MTGRTPSKARMYGRSPDIDRAVQKDAVRELRAQRDALLEAAEAAADHLATWPAFGMSEAKAKEVKAMAYNLRAAIRLAKGEADGKETA